MDILDLGNVAQRDGMIGEQGGREAGQRRVLVPARRDPPLEGNAPFDLVLVHGGSIAQTHGLLHDPIGTCYHVGEMSERIVLFGGGGFVGGNLARAALAQGWSVDIVDARAAPDAPDAKWHRVDITDAAAVRALVAELRPAAVIDLAAVADIDRAERERALAWAINVEAARTIASACAHCGAHVLYFSSDAVFEGTAARYAEEDPLDPVNYYGRTKAEGEAGVRAAHPGAAILRISLALGFPVTAGNSFLAGLEAALRAGGQITAPGDEIRTPVDVYTLASCVLELARTRFAGTLHVGSTDSIDRGSLTRRAAALMGYPDARIATTPAAGPAGGRAPRHRNGIDCRGQGAGDSCNAPAHCRAVAAQSDRDKELKDMHKPTVRYELEISHGSIYGKEEEAALLEVLRAGAPSCGKKVKGFEDAFAAYCGTRYALAVTSATTGLTLAGIAAGVGPGTEVITTPLSWIATANAFAGLGAKIVFCDVDPRSLNLDPDCLEKKITRKTRAIVPVHLGGQCCRHGQDHGDRRPSTGSQ